MSLAVDNPILNNPFEEPEEYWVYEEGQTKRIVSKVRGRNYILNSQLGYLVRYKERGDQDEKFCE